ncbi:thioredoxin domain-containing protein [Ordospora colligata]|uniref:Thioredoxin domain-containing protein n=1 Tax=Ordospora colligata OC4 TaxID=1354746 RepID=A0A0B2UM94_9MICR|nr:thioredoxin domain-containing protein [Ordospora colligata OC4]KHN70172.1 thioredoxin domain-containing protein [Ordospora colligata OC4]TBU16716.1 thioredoxin domain-containing protein [Ordospora colligata]TBU17022.1 thioredoxin domain-containing protein [Ordospora colligata]TBU19496.1 thioredoxin domain-containing protein [Ordospora colligata]
MILLYLLGCLAVITESCEPITNGYVLNKYFTPWCPACQKVEPLIEEISNKIDRHGIDIKIRNANCDECSCKNVASYPTLEMTKDGESVGKLEGFQDYDAIANFIVSHTGVDKSVFDGHIIQKEPSVRKLTKNDFLSGFDGPHVVLFYSREDDKYRVMFAELAKVYENRLTFGEISSAESAELINRYDIRSYPSISGIFNGLIVPFIEREGIPDMPKLIEFCDRLIEKSFQNLTLDVFNQAVSTLEQGEPIYVVFHKNLALAMQYFQSMAHMYKFKARIYRSDDPALFSKASIFPKMLGSEQNAYTTSDPADSAILSVYKNGVFYRYTDTFGDETKITDWIFHTHYKYLTKVDNQNFYSIFHGLKPVMILVTRGEQYVNKMNDFSADRHLGVPYTDMVFGTMDIDDYPLFIPSLLPKISVPSLVVFEPWMNFFYHKKVKLTEENFISTAMDTYNLYQNKKLPMYPGKSNKLMRYSILGLVIALIGAYCMSISRTAKKNK